MAHLLNLARSHSTPPLPLPKSHLTQPTSQRYLPAAEELTQKVVLLQNLGKKGYNETFALQEQFSQNLKNYRKDRSYYSNSPHGNQSSSLRTNILDAGKTQSLLSKYSGLLSTSLSSPLDENEGKQTGGVVLDSLLLVEHPPGNDSSLQLWLLLLLLL